MGRYKSPYTLYKRGKYWYFRTYSPEGKRTAGTSTGKTNKSAAKEMCDKLFLNGQLYMSNLLFKEYAQNYYDENSLYATARGKPLSPNTLRMYQRDLKNNILPYFENTKIVDINYTKLLQYRKYLIEERNFTLGSANLSLAILKPIINNAYKDEIISKNPFNFLTRISTTDSNRDAFTLDEVCKLYEIIKDRYKEIVAFTAVTGLRISELAGLEKTDIKYHPNGFYYINIERQIYNKKVCPPKRNSKRQIPVIPELVENFRPLYPEEKSEIYFLFKTLKKSFNNAEERKLSFHSLRHFFITNSKSCNIPDSKVEILAGHSLKGLTKVYTNFKVEDLTDILPWQKEIYYKIKKLPKD